MERGPRSDHYLVHLANSYTAIVQQQIVQTRTIRKWSQEDIETLQGSFEATDWDVLSDQRDINSMTGIVTE